MQVSFCIFTLNVVYSVTWRLSRIWLKIRYLWYRVAKICVCMCGYLQNDKRYSTTVLAPFALHV